MSVEKQKSWELQEPFRCITSVLSEQLRWKKIISNEKTFCACIERDGWSRRDEWFQSIFVFLSELFLETILSISPMFYTSYIYNKYITIGSS